MLHSCSHVQMHVWIIMQHSSTPTEKYRCRVLARDLAIVSRASPSHTRGKGWVYYYIVTVSSACRVYTGFSVWGGGGTPHLGVT